jgi:hypothetical protein
VSTLDKDKITTIYKKKRKLKSIISHLNNTNLTESLTKTVKTQSNHIVLFILAFLNWKL